MPALPSFEHLLRYAQHGRFWLEVAALVLSGLLAYGSSLWLKRQIQLWQNIPQRLSGLLARVGMPLSWLLYLSLASALIGMVGPVRGRWLGTAMELMAAWLVIRALLYVLRQGLPPSARMLAFERVLGIVVWPLVVLHLTGLSSTVIKALDDLSFAVGSQHTSVWLLLRGLSWIGLSMAIGLWLMRVLEDRLQQNQSLDKSTAAVILKISRVVVLALALMLGLAGAGINLTVLSVFGGALGVGLGLGLQKIASNYFNGFTLLAEGAIRLGDFVSVQQHSGVVSRITARHVALRCTTGEETLVPNDQMMQSIVANRTHSDRREWVGISFAVAYDNDIEQVKQLALAASQQQERVLLQPPPTVAITRLSEHSIEMELGVWISHIEEGSRLPRSAIYETLLLLFRQNNITLPYPKLSVSMAER